MNIDEATNILWQSTPNGASPAATLHKQLTMNDAYRVQLNILARRQAAGEKLAGWKIGLIRRLCSASLWSVCTDQCPVVRPAPFHQRKHFQL